MSSSPLCYHLTRYVTYDATTITLLIACQSCHLDLICFSHHSSFSRYQSLTVLTRRQFTEIIQIAGQVTCSRVLNFLAAMATKGYMRGALPQTQQFYAEVSSQFVLASANGGVIPSFAANATTTSKVTTASAAAVAIDSHVSQAVNGITTGALSAMVEGEQPAFVVTTNIRAKMQNQIVTNHTMAPFVPPPSAEEAQYHAPQPVIQVVGSNLLKCNFGGGYAQTASVQFGSNPHEGSTSITSPLLQFATRSTTKTPKSIQIATAVSASFAAVARGSEEATSTQHRQHQRVVDQRMESKSHRPEAKGSELRELTSGAVSSGAVSPSYAPTRVPTAPSHAPTISPTARPSLSRAPSLRPSPEPSRIPTASPTNVVLIPAYYVTLPLIGNKHYNLTQYRLSKGIRTLSNYSIPACSLYLGGKYVPCGACNITSFTMVNVTYGCYDITVLCPVATPSAATARRLWMDDGPGDYHPNGVGTLDVGGPLEEDEMDVSVGGSGYDFSYEHSSDKRVMLGLTETDMSPLSNHLSEIYRQLYSVGAGVGVRTAVGGGSSSRNGHDDLIRNTFNTTTTDDHSDDAPKSDDTLPIRNKFNVNEFGAFAENIFAELQTVLGLNFSQIDLAKAAPVLAFVAALTGVWLLGSLFFLRWDKSDRHRLVYLREYQVKAAYKLIKEDIHKGGTGVINWDDPSLAVGTASLHEQINHTLDTLKMSFSPKQFFNPHKRNSIYAGTHAQLPPNNL